MIIRVLDNQWDCLVETTEADIDIIGPGLDDIIGPGLDPRQWFIQKKYTA